MGGGDQARQRDGGVACVSAGLELPTAAPAPMTVKAAAAEQDDENNDEKNVHVWLQCDETTLA